MKNFWWIILALLAGAVLPFQAGLNARLGKLIHSPVWASLVSFAVGSAALVAYLVITRPPVAFSGLKGSPIVWVGGILGAFYVTAIILLIPRIGPALTFSLIVAGQMIVAVLLDHYNILVAAPSPITIYKIAGIILIVAGVILIRK